MPRGSARYACGHTWEGPPDAMPDECPECGESFVSKSVS